MGKKPKKFNLTAEQASDLLDRIDNKTLDDSDYKLLKEVVKFTLWLQDKLKHAKISLRRLKRLFGFNKSESKKNLQKESADIDAPESNDETSTADDDALVAPEDSVEENIEKEESQQEETSNKLSGHGRMAANDYFAKVIYISHDDLEPKQACPEILCTGKLYDITNDAGGVIRIIGHAPFSAERYVQQRLRCNLCGLLFVAPLPEEIGKDKYTVQAKSILCVNKYYLGMPLYRMETYQKLVGVPFADSTQWEQIEKAAGSFIPLFRYLEILAADGELFHHDDTKVRILSVLKHLADAGKKGKRKGVFTSGIVSKLDNEHAIYLFYSGRQHAGENLDDILDKRNPDLPEPIKMSDALNANNIKKIKVKEANCLAHGRRKFAELHDVFPDECNVVIDNLSLIYKHDAYCQEQGLDKFARLAYHKKFSAPVMQKLETWLKKQINDKLIEPNSHLGKAINYMLNHWPALTLFLREPGAPLDNNIVERALKIIIRHRKASLFYKTEYSAFIGSMITSIIYTSIMAGANPIEYLNALQCHSLEVMKNPGDWLPWTYMDTITCLSSFPSLQGIRPANQAAPEPSQELLVAA